MKKNLYIFIIHLSLHLLSLIYSLLIDSLFSSRGRYWIADYFGHFCSCQIYTTYSFKTRGHTFGLGLASGSGFFICCDLWVTVCSLTLNCDWLEVAGTEECLGRGSGTGTERDGCKMQSCRFVICIFSATCWYVTAC